MVEDFSRCAERSLFDQEESADALDEGVRRPAHDRARGAKDSFLRSRVAVRKISGWPLVRFLFACAIWVTPAESMMLGGRMPTTGAMLSADSKLHLWHKPTETGRKLYV